MNYLLIENLRYFKILGKNFKRCKKMINYIFKYYIFFNFNNNIIN